MSGRHADASRQILAASVVVAVLLFVAGAVVLVHDIGRRSGRPHVVQLVSPSVSPPATSSAG